MLPVSARARLWCGRQLRKLLGLPEPLKPLSGEELFGKFSEAYKNFEHSKNAVEEILKSDISPRDPEVVAKRLFAANKSVSTNNELKLALALSQRKEEPYRWLGLYYLIKRASVCKDFVGLLSYWKQLSDAYILDETGELEMHCLALEAMRRMGLHDDWRDLYDTVAKRDVFGTASRIQYVSRFFETDRSASVKMLRSLGSHLGQGDNRAVAYYMHHLFEEKRYDDVEQLARIRIANNSAKLFDRCFISNTLSARDKSTAGLQGVLRELGINSTIHDLKFDAISCAPEEIHNHGPLASVVMTAFNAAKHIETSIGSILRQTYGNFELIVVDDCSTDETRALLNRVATQDSRVKIVGRPTNCGTYVCKNEGIRQAKGQYILLCDSDDMWTPHHLEKHIRSMQSNSDVMITNSNWIRIDNNGAIIISRNGFVIENCPHSTCFRKEVFERIGYFDPVRFGADREFLTRAQLSFDRNQIQTIPSVLSLGRKHSNSLTTSGASAISVDNISPVRLKYWSQWNAWHLSQIKKGELPHMVEQKGDRNFEIASALMP